MSGFPWGSPQRPRPLRGHEGVQQRAPGGGEDHRPEGADAPGREGLGGGVQLVRRGPTGELRYLQKYICVGPLVGWAATVARVLGLMAGKTAVPSSAASGPLPSSWWLRVGGGKGGATPTPEENTPLPSGI